MQSGFYRYIYKKGKKFWVVKNNEWYVECETLAEALYERDRLISCDWDWDVYVQLPETNNNYIHISLPPFEHKPKYISHVKEHWVVLSNGRNPKYYGTYYSEEEAKEVAKIYSGRIGHRRGKYRVQRRINGVTVHFGLYDTLEEAEERVFELIENGWIQ